MLGGALDKSFSGLDTPDSDESEKYYAPLKIVVDKYKLDGLSLDYTTPTAYKIIWRGTMRSTHLTHLLWIGLLIKYWILNDLWI